MNQQRQEKRPVRTPLDHSTHFHGRFGATYFITICCEARGQNQLCNKQTASAIFETARRYHEARRWYVKALVVMPDHLHMLVGVPGDEELSKLVRDFKRITTRNAQVNWQRNFFDHRLRHDESETEKADYILANPARVGLTEYGQKWQFAITAADLEPRTT